MISIILLIGCSSSELIENWKNPDISTFEAKKVFVIGITPNLDNRKVFEQKLTSELRENNVNAFRSLDFFERFYADSPITEEGLMKLETELLQEGFDAILLSKVIGVEDKVTVLSTTRNLDKTFKSFRNDYYENQDIYFQEDYYNEYQIFHAQSSLYCICPDKEKEIIWRGSIDVTEPENIKKAVNDYVKILIWALKEQQLLIIESNIDENPNI